jgi:hypothetical protein
MITISAPAPRVLRSALALGITALLAVGVSACSHPAANSHPAVRPAGLSVTSTAAAGSACALVSTDEVTAAIGKPMGPGNDAGTVCFFSATSDKSLVLYVQIYGDAQSLAAPKDVETGSQHLTGLGDDAFWSSGGILFVQKGSRAFTISVPSLALTSTTAPEAIVTLATDAAGRF